MSKGLVAALATLMAFSLPAPARAADAAYPYAAVTAASVGPAPACVDPDPVPMRAGRWIQVSFTCENAASFAVAEVTHGAVMSFQSYGSHGALYFQADHAHSGEGTVKLLVTNAEGSDDLTLRFAISPTYNRPPVCEDVPFDLRLGTRRTAQITCADPDSDSITYTRATVPVHGTAGFPYSSSSEGMVPYSAPASTQETLPLADPFTVRADDGYGGTDTVTVTPTVQPMSFNQAPTGCYASGGLWGQVAYSGQPRSFYISCNDPDGDPLEFSITSPPSSPGATLVPGSGPQSFVFTPGAGYTGSDSFTITATDGTANVAVTTAFEVKEPPAPSCQTPPVARVRPGASRLIGGSCPVPTADGFPGEASYEIVDPPDHGKLTDGFFGRVAPEPGASSWTYTPATDAVSGDTDSFTYVATANGKSAPPVTQQIVVDPQTNERPHCFGPNTGAHRLRTSQTRRLRITCSDADGDELTITTGDPAHGSIVEPTRTGNVLEVSYDPDAGYLGQDTVTWQVDDGYAGGTTGQPGGQIVYTVIADEANTKPYCHPGQVPSGPRTGERYSIAVQCSDAEGDPLTLETSGAVNGTIVEVIKTQVADSASFRVIFEAGSVGEGEFTAQAHDGREASNKVGYGFPVRPADVNTPPFCWLWPPFAIAVDAAKGFEIPRYGNACADFDQDPLDMRIHTHPSHGTLVENAGGWVYTPEPGYSGPDELAISVTDGRSTPLIQKLLLKVYATDEVHTTLTGGPTGTTKARTATFQFTSPLRPEATFECRLDPVESTAWTPCSSGAQLSDLADGEHEFQVRGVDGGEKDSTPATRRWTVDGTGPGAPVMGGKPAAFTSAQAAAITFTGSDDAASFECKLDGGEFAACESPKQLTGLADGEHTVSVRGVDALGNAGAVATHAWTVDTAAPETVLVAGPSGETDATAAAFSFEGGASYECSLDAGEFAPCTSPAALTGLAVAAHTFSVRAVDAAGNVDATPASRTWTVVAAPASEPAPPIAPPAPAPAPAAKDGKAPTLTLSAPRQRIKAAIAKGLRVEASCDEVCAITLTVTVRLGGRAVKVGSASVLTSGRSTVKVPKKVATKLRRLKSAVLTLSAGAMDPAGNTAAQTVRVTLKR